MTNPIKAPRLCTLWGQTFDSNNVIRIGVYDELGYCVGIGIKKPNGSKYHFTYYFDSEAQALLKMLEAIQAIASAQRPWLKAEGFEFVEGERYEVLHIHGGTLMHDIGEFGKYGEVQGIDSANFADVGYIIAFKPVISYDPTDTPQQRLAKEQEAWDAVAHVEAWEG